MSRVFLAGAAGAVGAPLTRLLVAAGHAVTGTTRAPTRADAIRRADATPVVVDVFDAAALTCAMAEARPEIVIHQLTDLPPGLDPARMAEATIRNARLRREGTRNLVDASIAAGARRLIAQSIAWAYAPGPEPHREDDQLDLAATGARSVGVAAVAELERLTLRSPPLAGIVLRYGQLYGPGTGRDRAEGACPVHVDAAAHAALLALDRGAPGAFNVAEDCAYLSSAKARRELGWDPGFRLAER